MNKRKICFVITSEIHYSRNKLILDELKRHDDVVLQIVVAAGALLDVYGDVIPHLKRDGFACDAKIFMTLQGGSSISMAKTTGIGIVEFSSIFDRLKPDVVLLRGDRYEMLAAAISAAYLNIPIAHIEGGDVSGNIDEMVRHAITKLSHIHFTTNELSMQHVLRIGERPDYVFNVGSPEIELISLHTYEAPHDVIRRVGVGGHIDLSKPYMVVMYHPVTSEMSKNEEHVESLIHAVHTSKIPTIWFWPNPDAGTDEIAGALRRYREQKDSPFIRFMKYQSNEIFMGILKHCRCLIGNSSAGMKECSYLGVPVVNIGTRQARRLRGDNVIDADYDADKIQEAIVVQFQHGPFSPSNLYYKKDTSKQIVDILTSIPLYSQKKFYDFANSFLSRETNARPHYGARRIERYTEEKRQEASQ